MTKQLEELEFPDQCKKHIFFREKKPRSKKLGHCTEAKMEHPSTRSVSTNQGPSARIIKPMKSSESPSYTRQRTCPRMKGEAKRRSEALLRRSL
ncbi:hypothetical protein M5689_024647 [Euphorbia peplus]|nr:hypothetical protein M5689_024647 [Euphorbia peplus]